MLSDPAMVTFNRCISYPCFTALFICTLSKEPLRGLVRFQTCELGRRGNKSSLCQKWGWSSSWVKAGRVWSPHITAPSFVPYHIQYYTYDTTGTFSQNENFMKGFISHCWKSTCLFQQLCVARSRLERKRDVIRINENTCVIAWPSLARFLRCYKNTYERLGNNASRIDSCVVLKNQGLLCVFFLSQTRVYVTYKSIKSHS
jgi:hypothetical protein